MLKPHRIRIHKGPYVPPKPLIQELSNFEDTSCSYEDKLPGIEKNECSGQKYFRLIENTRTRILIGEFYLPKVVSVNFFSNAY